VRCIEHGHLADDPTAQMMAETETWWSLQPFLDDEDAYVIPDPAGRAKQLQVTAGTDRSYALARKHGVKVAWGSDILFDASLAARQGRQLAKMTRWFTPAEVLVSATSGNAELLALCGPRNPHPGRLGVVEPGALADLLLVDGDPIANIDLLADPDRSLLVIMKDGRIHKDSAPSKD
jgi:imidazolonepropionase-like amidohydrolase